MKNETYYTYPNEPIGRGNPYYCCSACGRSDPQINGRLDGHYDWRKWMIEKKKEIAHEKKKIPTKTYWYVPEYCSFAIPVKITDVDDGFGEHNCLVDIDEPIGHIVYLDELYTSLKDAKLAIRMTKDENRLQEYHDRQFIRQHTSKTFRHYNWFHILRRWRRMRIDGIVGTWPEEYRNKLSLKDYKNKKVYRVK